MVLAPYPVRDFRVLVTAGGKAGGGRAIEARRLFPITIKAVDGIDDWTPPQVRAAISDWLASCPTLEGILFVGNVKLPSFFMPRADLPETRLWHRYYEDPNLRAERRIEAGTVLQPASEPNPTWPFIAGKTRSRTTRPAIRAPT